MLKPIQASPESGVNNTLATAYFDESYRIIYANEEFCQLLGYTQSEFFKMNMEELMQLVHPEDRDHIIQRLKLLEDNGTSEIIEPRKYIKKDGTLISVIHTKKIVRDFANHRVAEMITLEPV